MKLILFDIDGTLLISRGIGREAKRRAMLECFGTVGDLDKFAFGGKTDWRILADSLAAHGYSSEDIGRVIGSYETIMARHMRQIMSDYQAEPLPHAMQVLRALRKRADMLIGIVTGNTSLTAAIKLEMAGFEPGWFPIGAYGHESPERADLTRLAQRRAEEFMGCSLSARDIIVIGDTPADIQAAHAIGAIAVAVCTGYAERESLARCQPEHLLDDLGRFTAEVLG